MDILFTEEKKGTQGIVVENPTQVELTQEQKNQTTQLF